MTTQSLFANELQVKLWKESAFLPTDQHSIENAIILHKTKKCSLIIDPQDQGSKFIKNLARISGEEIVVMKNKSVSEKLQSAVQEGKWVLIENLKGEVEQDLMSFLVHNPSDETIQVGNATLTYNKNFKLFITMKEMPSQGSSQNLTHLTIVNFALTPEKLESQLFELLKKNKNDSL